MTAATSEILRDDERSRRDFYDEVFLATSLQGLANRAAPQLYVRYDASWMTSGGSA